MTITEKEIREDFERFIRHEAMRANITQAELKEILGNSIDMLPEKERIVVILYYYEDLTLREISEIMKVSESRISQLHTKAILRLKGRLGRQKSTLME